MATANTRDVIVIGGGIFGLSCAWSCLKRGLSVTVLEGNYIGSGASGGVMGAMSPNVPERWNDKKQFQLDALLSAAEHWAEVEEVSGKSTGYGRIGRLIPVMDERGLGHAQKRAVDAVTLWHGKATWTIREAEDYAAWIDPDVAPLGVVHENLSARIFPLAACLALARAIDANTFWQGKATWTIREAEDYAPWIDPDVAPFGVVYENLSARIFPLAACLALARAIEAKGGEILEGWRVTEIGDHEVSGVSGTLKAGAVILSAGAESFPFLEPFLGPDAGFGVKGQAALLTSADMASAPTIFADHTYIIPHADGKVAVGSTTENTWDDPRSTDERLNEVIIRARAISPPLRDARVALRWANLRPRGKKPDPMLGRVPGAEGLYLATGGFKIGVGISHAVGEALAGMVAGETPWLPEKFFVRLPKPKGG